MDAYFDVLTDFNPHSHEGSDNKRKLWAYSVRNFNPHSHEGSDPILLSNHLLIYLFQSTLPRRERPSVGELLRTIADFNPHSHEGSDLNKKCITTV